MEWEIEPPELLFNHQYTKIRLKVDYSRLVSLLSELQPLLFPEHVDCPVRKVPDMDVILIQ